MADAESFALMLETACRDFEVLDRIIRKQTTINAATPIDSFKDQAAIKMAMAKSFVFFTARAARICEYGGLELPSEVRKRFLRVVKPLLTVRDVNEHGFDPPKTRNKKSHPSMHHHHNDRGSIDETSLFISSGKVLMGPLNLYDFYKVVSEIREIAGFAALHEKNHRA